MNFSTLFSILASAQKDYTAQIVISYVIIALVVAFIVFIVLVNKNIVMKKDNPFRRFITHPLFFYSLKRIGSALFSIVIALAITFCLIRMQDLELTYCFPHKIHYNDDESYRRFCDIYMDSLGLSGSLLEQFIKYLYNIIPIPKQIVTVNPIDSSATVEFAIVYLGRVTPKSSDIDPLIWDAIARRMPVSFRWSALATVLQILIGYPLGVAMAKNQDKLVDKIGKTYIILINAIPGLLYFYLLYTMFLQLDYSGVKLFPMGWENDNFSTWLAPAISSAFAGVAGIAYWVRRYMLNEINSDYVKYARAKGLPERTIMYKHVLRNAIVPLSRSLSTAFLGLDIC